MRGSVRLCRGASVAPEDLARTATRLCVILQGEFAVDEHVPVASRALNATPLTAGQIVHLLDWQDLEGLEVVNDPVRGLPPL